MLTQAAPDPQEIILQTMEIESGRRLINQSILPQDIDGGYTNDPDDPGGETNWGFTANTLKELEVGTPVSELTFSDAYELYVKFFYNKCGAKAIYPQHPWLARVLFNYAVHAGVHAATRRLQMLLNLHNNQGSLWPDIKEDGVFGRNTHKTFTGYLAHRGDQGKDILFMDYLIAAGAHYQELARKKEVFEKYNYGWMRRILEDMERYF